MTSAISLLPGYAWLHCSGHSPCTTSRERWMRSSTHRVQAELNQDILRFSIITGQSSGLSLQDISRHGISNPEEFPESGPGIRLPLFMCMKGNAYLCPSETLQTALLLVQMYWPVSWPWVVGPVAVTIGQPYMLSVCHLPVDEFGDGIGEVLRCRSRPIRVEIGFKSPVPATKL
jgi:hypothetical protein